LSEPLLNRFLSCQRRCHSFFELTIEPPLLSAVCLQTDRMPPRRKRARSASPPKPTTSSTTTATATAAIPMRPKRRRTKSTTSRDVAAAETDDDGSGGDNKSTDECIENESTRPTKGVIGQVLQHSKGYCVI